MGYIAGYMVWAAPSDPDQFAARYGTVADLAIVVLTGTGIAILSWTLWETRRATRAAQESTSTALLIGTKQLQPQVHVVGLRLFMSPYGLSAEFDMRNAGAGPASGLCIEAGTAEINRMCSERGLQTTLHDVYPYATKTSRISMLPANSSTTIKLNPIQHKFETTEAQELASHAETEESGLLIYYSCAVSYSDSFSARHSDVFWFSCHLKGSGWHEATRYPEGLSFESLLKRKHALEQTIQGFTLVRQQKTSDD